MKKLVAFVLLGMCCFVLTPQAWAEVVTRQLPFSKEVTLVVPRTYLFKMELCTDAACTDTAYAETQKIVLRTGTLSFKLGAGTVDPTSPAFSEVDFSQQYWLRISRSTATGFLALGPATKLSVVPYALWSNQVEGIGAGVGTITAVYGGDGLSGSATTGAATLNVGAGSGIEVGADTVSIAAGGVTSAHIQDGAVTSTDIADGTVASADIATGGVTSASILDGTVTSADIANGTVASADIATGGVTSANILDGTVTSVDIAANTLTGANVQDGTIAATDLQDGTARAEILDDDGTGSLLDADYLDGLHSSAFVPYAGGNATVTGGYRFAASKTGYFSVAATALIGEGIVRHVGFGEAYLYPAITQTWAVQSVNLPDGATITELRCVLRDNDTGYLNINLSRNTAQDSSAVASISTNGLANNPATQTVITTTITNPTVNNANYAYTLVVYLTGTPNTRELSINRCRVAYTVTELAP